MSSIPPELTARVGALAKSMGMNTDAIALLTRKAEAMRETLRLQSAVTAENGVSQRYQERIDELAGQVEDYKYALSFVANEKKKMPHDQDRAQKLETEVQALKEDKVSLEQALRAAELEASNLKLVLAQAAQQDEQNAAETEEMLDHLAEENSRLKAELRKKQRQQRPGEDGDGADDEDDDDDDAADDDEHHHHHTGDGDDAVVLPGASGGTLTIDVPTSGRESEEDGAEGQAGVENGKVE